MLTNAEKAVSRNMPLTHNFKETIQARARKDSKFRKALLLEAVESYLNGDLETGKAVLRDYVNATLGFQALEEQTDIPVKSLMRMLGPKGSPSAANFANIFTACRKPRKCTSNWHCGPRTALGCFWGRRSPERPDQSARSAADTPQIAGDRDWVRPSSN